MAKDAIAVTSRVRSRKASQSPAMLSRRKSVLRLASNPPDACGAPCQAKSACARSKFSSRLYIHHSTGSHARLFHRTKPVLRVTVPIQSRDLPLGTLKNILRQAGLSVDEFPSNYFDSAESVYAEVGTGNARFVRL